MAIMCRNHRWFVEASIACSKLGANAIYLNTSFAGPQVTEVVAREGPTAIVYDEEFAHAVAPAAERPARLRGLADDASRRPARSDPHPRGADRHAAPADPLPPPAGARPDGDPDLGHDRHAQGRQPGQPRARSARPRRCCPRSRCTRARRHDDRRAAVSLLGLRPHVLRHGAGLDRSSCAAASIPRRRCGRWPSTRPRRSIVVPVMLQRILELQPRDDRGATTPRRCG